MARRLFICLVIHLLGLGSHAIVLAQQSPTQVIFINGIQNTLEDAIDSMTAAQDALNETTTRNSNNKRRFNVGLIWNPIGFHGEEHFFDGREDNIELVLLKISEECFRNDFRAIVVPHNQPRPIDIGAAQRVKAYLDNMLPGEHVRDDNCGWNNLRVAAHSLAGTKSAALALAQQVRDQGRSIVVAHSQGNLLAHLSYAALAVEHGNDVNQMMRIVNVANTSELSAHRLNMTHASDAALSLLTGLPRIWIPDIQRSTPECAVPVPCPFRIAAPTLNTPTDSGFRDAIGRHSFVDTYLSTYRVPVLDTQGVAFTAGADRFVDRFVDFVYAAAESLDAANPPAAPSIEVDAASCTSPVVGEPMACTLFGSNLPETALFSATNCNPDPMTAMSGGTSRRRQFSCSPVTAGQSVTVSYSVPGFSGTLPGIPTRPAASPPVPDPPPPSPSPSPDLRVQGISFFPSAVTVDRSIIVSFEVVNTGNATANASTAVVRINQSDTSAAGTNLATVGVSSLAVGASQGRSVTVNSPSSPGTYRVWVIADNTNTAGQDAAAQANDRVVATGVLTVASASDIGPDMVSESLSFNPTATIPGGQIMVSFTVANRGNAQSSASSASVRISQSDTSPGDVNSGIAYFGVTGVNGTRSHSMYVPTPTTPGEYRVWLVLNDPGQTSSAMANDRALATGVLTVASADPVPGASAEGAYTGTTNAGQFTHFRMIVLENDEFWTLYGGRNVFGELSVGGFFQGQGMSNDGNFVVSTITDYGLGFPIAGSANATYNSIARTIAGQVRSFGVTGDFAGGPVAETEYDYNRTPSMFEVQGAWSLRAGNRETIALNVSDSGTFTAQWSQGCSSPGTIAPRPSGKNVFDLNFRLEGSTCLAPGLSVTGIGIIVTLPSGRKQLVIAGHDPSRVGGGMFAVGER